MASDRRGAAPCTVPGPRAGAGAAAPAPSRDQRRGGAGPRARGAECAESRHPGSASASGNLVKPYTRPCDGQLRSIPRHGQSSTYPAPQSNRMDRITTCSIQSNQYAHLGSSVGGRRSSPRTSPLDGHPPVPVPVPVRGASTMPCHTTLCVDRSASHAGRCALVITVPSRPSRRTVHVPPLPAPAAGDGSREPPPPGWLESLPRAAWAGCGA